MCCIIYLYLGDIMEHIIVAATGIGYAIVGALQLAKGDSPNAMIWSGYAFAQIGLWINLK